MSSDEEEDEEDQAMDQGGDEILPFKQYLIRVPQWRSEAVTGFLRVFDILYLRARADGVFGGQRGAFPHARSTSLARSTNLRFVSRLPENAYDERWLRGLVDRAVLRARPPVAYHHSPETLQYFELTVSATICILILLQACLWYKGVVWGYTVFITTKWSWCLLFIVAVHFLSKLLRVCVCK